MGSGQLRNNMPTPLFKSQLYFSISTDVFSDTDLELCCKYLQIFLGLFVISSSTMLWLVSSLLNLRLTLWPYLTRLILFCYHWTNYGAFRVSLYSALVVLSAHCAGSTPSFEISKQHSIHLEGLQAYATGIRMRLKPGGSLAGAPDFFREALTPQGLAARYHCEPSTTRVASS